MNALTSENIKLNAKYCMPGHILHSATIAYIQFLLKPYAETLENVTTVEGIKEWIRKSFPNNNSLGAGVVMFIVEYPEKWIERLEQSDYKIPVKKIKIEKNDQYISPDAKRLIIDNLLRRIIVWYNEVGDCDTIVLPWDIQQLIANSPGYSEMFGITEGQNKLPVTFVGTCVTFTELLSMEFTVGLLLANNNREITMFGVPFTLAYLLQTCGELDFYTSRFLFNEKDRYSVEVKGKKYGFNSPDFVEGFSMGARWAGIKDYHEKITDHTPENPLPMFGE